MDPKQEMSNETLETILVSSTKGSNNKKMEEEMKKKMGRGELGGEAQKCPRCESPNTKFCYYNNYSLSQPRYFCKSCRRYWTKGGTLRNVPVGGGCRRNKRSSSSAFSKNNNNKPISFHNDPLHNPLITGTPSSFGYDSIDLNLAFATLQKHSSSPAPTSFGFGGDLSIYGNSTNAHSDVFGNRGIFGGQNGNFNNGSFCYGFIPGNENHESKTSSLGVSLEGNQRKQEIVNNNNNVSENHSKVLWGFPWQMTGDSTGAVPEIDPGRESWNGLASSWHNGLLNTPLV